MKKTEQMDQELERAYASFGKMMAEDEVYRNPALTFEEICRRIGIPVGRLDRYIYSEMGMTGRQLMEAYRRNMTPGEASQSDKMF